MPKTLKELFIDWLNEKNPVTKWSRLQSLKHYIAVRKIYNVIPHLNLLKEK